MNLGPKKIFCKRRLKISYLLGVSFPKKKEKYTRFNNLLWAFTSQKCFMILELIFLKYIPTFNEFIAQLYGYDFLESR